MTIYNDEDTFPVDSQDFRSILRADNELFNEDDSAIIHPVINVKRIRTSKSEQWQIITNGKVALLLKAARLTSAEKEYLRTVKGMQFLIEEYKNGSRTVSKIKEELKKIV